jgi:hypothetical protein
MLHIVATLEETDEVYKALDIRKYRPTMSVQIACLGLLLSRHELRRMDPYMYASRRRLWQEVNEMVNQ